MPNNLDINTLETWLWDAACKIRGAKKKAKGSGLHIAQIQLATEGVDVSFQSFIFL